MTDRFYIPCTSHSTEQRLVFDYGELRWDMQPASRDGEKCRSARPRRPLRDRPTEY